MRKVCSTRDPLSLGGLARKKGPHRQCMWANQRCFGSLPNLNSHTVFPESYPFGEINVFIRKPRIPSSTPHLFGDKSLCLSHGDITTETLSAQIVDWTVEWCVAYKKFKRTGRWPARVRKSKKRKGRL